MQDASARFRIEDDGTKAMRQPTVVVRLCYGEDATLESLAIVSGSSGFMSAYQFDALVALVKKHRKFGETR